MKIHTVNKVLKKRLLGAIDSLKNEKDNYSSDDHKSDLAKIEAALTNAEKFANMCEFDLGWNQLFIAEQQLVRCMTSEQKIIKANNLRIEASKISGWRQEQIFGHISRPPKNNEAPPVVDSADKIIEAMKIRNDFYNTRNNRMGLRQASLDSLAISLLIIIVAIIAMSFFLNPVEIFKSDNLPFQIIFAVLFGMLGASFSMAHSLSTTTLEIKIPELLLGIFVTVIRLAIGGTSAFIIIILFKAQFLDRLFSDAILKSPFICIVVSFLSGFSERWVFGILESATKNNK